MSSGAAQLPFPRIDALLLGAHRPLCAQLPAPGEGERIDGSSCIPGKREGVAIPALTDEALFKACGVRIAFTGREGGASAPPFDTLNLGSHVDDEPPAVRENRRRVLAAIGAEGLPCIVPAQVHGTDAVLLPCSAGEGLGAASMPRGCDGPAFERELEDAREAAAQGADIVVVSQPGVAALMCFADCLPLAIASPDGSFALAHAGWRGAVAHVAAKAARLLAEQSGVPARQFNAYIGPHIRSECFEVGPDVARAFRTEFGDGVVAGERHVSLERAVRLDLAAAGLEDARIADAGLCTKCHPERFFSYRASGGICGRHAAIAVRVS